MNNLLLKNQTINEADVIASRRGFLTRMAYGSLLAMGGSGIVQAATKHITHAPAAKKSEAKKTVSSVKSAVHERLALKTEHNRHGSKADDRHEDNRHASKSGHDHHYDDNRHASRSAHEHDYGRHHHELASNNHSRIHTSLDRDHDGGYRMHYEERERLALESNPSAHQLLHREMPEFATQAEMELDESNSISGGRIALPNNNGRFANVNHKTLALQNLTTGDSLNVTYFERGRYLPDALSEINYIYRDHLTDDIHPIDTALLDQLHDLQATLGVSKKTIHVVCGYRSPFTNAYLRRNSSGVAKNSLHMQGRAIDIRIAGIDSRTVRDAALSMASGGVGYYPGSNFVHLDTGDVRTW
jgi:uncharacterized protein YcbK (DUF882 family)